jgi:protein ImuB
MDRSTNVDASCEEVSMSYAAIYIPEFPIAAWLRGAPSISGPLAVLEGVAPQEKIIALNPMARKAGLARGMGKAQAETMCATVFRARQIAEEELAFAGAMEIAERFSPRVQALASPANAYGGTNSLAASLLVDASGTQTLFGDLKSYANKLQHELAASGFATGIGAAPNAQAALLFSRSGRNIVCVHANELRARLATLPVSLLQCESRMLSLLLRWGIRTLGQLAALPEQALISRLGQGGQHLQQLARGDSEHLLLPEEEAFTLSETTVLDSPLELLEPLLFVLSPMLEAIMRKAIGRAYALRVVRVTLQLEGAAPHTVAVRPALPTQNREALLKLMNLELQAHPPQAEIVSVTLDAEAAQPQTAQRGLFQAQFPEPDKLDLLLARLRSIAGEHNVGSAELSNSHRHDAFTMAAFQPSLRSVAKDSGHASCLALRVCRPAQAVRVACQGNQPRALFWQGMRRTISSCAGPWHSSGSWWDGKAWDDDMWDIVITEPVQSMRLMRAQASQAWFVVGLYD